MAVTYREMTYKTFGRGLAIENGVIELYVTLDVGPRIIRYSTVGGANVMHEDIDAKLVEKGADFDEVFYPGAYWRPYGGHRIWLTPEVKPGTYNPDNDPITYEVDGNVFTFIPPVQETLQVAERMIVTVSEDSSEVAVRAEVKNLADKPQTMGIWQISVMCQNGMEVVPQTLRDTVLLHNRRMSLWPYCEMNDERVYWGKTLITLRQDPTVNHPFKIGTSNERKFSAYLCNGDLFVKRFAWSADLAYPDDGCNFETYTNPNFLEIESLGQLVPVESGSTISGEEVWSLTPNVPAPAANDEAALMDIIAKYIEK